MNIKNIISNTLILSFLFSNISSTSLAGSWSEDGRYETIKGNDITIDNIIEEDTVRIKAKGNTLVNLYKKQIPIGRGGTLSSSNDVYRLTKDSTTDSGYLQFALDGHLFKPNTKYTLFFKKYYNTAPRTVVLHDRTNSRFASNIVNINDFNSKYVLETRGDFDENSSIELLFYTASIENEYVELSNEIVLVEGEIDCSSLEYFEGIKSSFENELVTQEMIDSGLEDRKNLGKYKVNFASAGRNIFNGNWITNKTIEYITGEEIDYPGEMCTDYIKVKGNEWYSIYLADEYITSNPDYIRVYFYDKNKLPIKYDNSKAHDLAFTAGSLSDARFKTMSHAKYIRVRLVSTNPATRMQVENTSLSNSYEPYREDSLSLYLSSPLLKDDAIEVINGNFYHVKNSRVTVLNDTIEQFHLVTQNSNSVYTQFNIGHEFGKFAYNSLLSDRFKTFNGSGDGPHIEKEGITAMHKDVFVIKVANSRLDDVSCNGFKSWLSRNPVVIVHNTSVPKYEKVGGAPNISLFEGTTNISNDSEIPLNMEVTIDRTINKAIEYINLAKTNPTIENIEIARMWSNLLKDSIKKDDLQSSIDEITEITDLSIDRRKVSANLDLYVKSENALSMSLDTNSVTFENYNNTEDMEKLGAVNITVSSSLPYDLNAYMSSGISNTDGTKTMDSNLLNIREDSTSSYKPFVGVDTKISLKEDCSAGNNNIHTIDFKLNGSQSYDVDIYRTVIKFEAEQK